MLEEDGGHRRAAILRLQSITRLLIPFYLIRLDISIATLFGVVSRIKEPEVEDILCARAVLDQ